MLDKINKLIDALENKEGRAYEGLIALAHKVEESVSTGRVYLLIDIKEMESMISPDRVDVEDHIGSMELDL
jgi:hypothetical protein